MKPFLQILHFSLLITGTIAFLLFIRFSDIDQDEMRFVIDLFSYLIVGSWSMVVFIGLLISPKTDTIQARLINMYRQFLVNNWFLSISNFILFVFCLILCYQLLFYRQVEFITKVDTKISQRIFDKENATILIGETKAGIPFKKRIKVKSEPYRFVFISLESEDIVDIRVFKVNYFWQNKKILRCILN